MMELLTRKHNNDDLFHFFELISVLLYIRFPARANKTTVTVFEQLAGQFFSMFSNVSNQVEKQTDRHDNFLFALY